MKKRTSTSIEFYPAINGERIPDDLVSALNEIGKLRDIFNEHNLNHLLGKIVYFPNGKPRAKIDGLNSTEDIVDYHGQDVKKIILGQMINVTLGFTVTDNSNNL